MKYMIIGGNPFTSYTGTTTFTSLSIYAKDISEHDIKEIINKAYEDCAGLIIVLDENGNVANI